ncbi:phytanoyl-CoA dioxygenase family protein [Candidatus Poribacteria bacterium]|jgi:phytanoyl-CoA hydroxylase|nr:phytanoyl-CoA dioxygenase family protein [Candidatus Poribacteria bacterium]MBT5534343.1 phytanoyl-CoA dioxygenase family protein [Candidatus Poribacteria bacterium]MBT5713316.1 phytanoyl-CoA dioxygenase family protein [Candidatus Poribacteria bacterium]MBT7100975.1 phytanoyl-CoA dioxygenase family protein [Candidatus Poribacteria bacterium]MBT7809460.1 phytanoyl-CoA dioxygenase family protein [Candidatus Poribacteria bacterium]
MPYALGPEQLRQYDDDGYCVARGFIDAESLAVIRARIGAALDEDDADAPWRRDASRKDGAAIQGQGRFRKIGQYARRDAGLWDAFLTHDSVIDVNRHFLGGDIRLWFDSVFTKPGKVGEETPWHQDIGLWTFHPSQKGRTALYRDAVSIWLAVDAATRENGCLQFVPGSHLGPVVDHVQYDDAIHSELPRELLEGVDPTHVELVPGDAVIWHAHAWHYSPPNMSDANRWGIACVTLREDAAREAELTQLPRLVVDTVPRPFGSQ